MQKIKHELDDVLSALSTDAPSFDRDQLRAIIAEPSKVDIQKNSFNKKGLFIMSTSILLIASLMYFFGGQTTTTPAHIQQHTNASQSVTQPQNATGIERPDDPSNPDGGKGDGGWRDSLKTLSFKQIDVEYLQMYAAKQSDMPKLAITVEPNGLISNYHKDYKISYPLDKITYIHNVNDKDPLTKEYGSLGIYPSYVTDTRGNLILIYKYETKDGGEVTHVNTIESEKKGLQRQNYYRVTSNGVAQVDIDTIAVPKRVKRAVWVQVGIMQSDDTVFWSDVNSLYEKETWVKSMTERLAKKDSLFKMQFGGEEGIEKRFRFPMPGVKYPSRSYQAKLLAAVDSIDRTESRPMERVRAKIDLISGYIRNPLVPDTVKLCFEQYSRRFQYEWYLLDHKEKEEKLANIDKLVPVLIRPMTGYKNDTTYDNGLIFWYEESAELRKAIPQAFGQSKVSGSSGSFEVSLFPNPASKIVFAKFTLTKETKLAVDLFDLLGKEVRRDLFSADRTKGSYTESLNIEGIPSGIYLLRLTTSTGGQSIQRIVIK